MNGLPIVSHHRPDPSPQSVVEAEGWAESLLAEQSGLRLPDGFRKFVAEELTGAPALHLDDLSEIPLLDRYYDVTFMQDRARLRAGSGDFVATSLPANRSYENYCREMLCLGAPTWLNPVNPTNPLNVALGCWKDRVTRHTLVHALRAGDVLYLHPHMGTLSVWELAAMLHRTSRRPIKVVAPHPALTKRVNDKLWFSRTVVRLFGDEFVPPTARACNFANLAQLVREFSELYASVVLKLPDSAGGGGNLVVEAAGFRNRPLKRIRQDLSKLLEGLAWQAGNPLLVGCWEPHVLCAPSIQTWIPPESGGPPVVEGIYQQMLEGRQGCFVGSVPACLPPALSQELVNRSWLLARCYQRLGYVGRCSFDALLTGKNPAHARIEFIECNGRWGGTSLLMTLMNRLFRDWTKRPYAHRECSVPGLNQLEFGDLLEYFSPDLFDGRTGRGRLLLYNPGRMQASSGINVLALADSWAKAKETVRREFPEQLKAMVAQRVTLPI